MRLAPRQGSFGPLVELENPAVAKRNAKADAQVTMGSLIDKYLTDKRSERIRPRTYATIREFAASFSADVRPDLASFMADSQVPWDVAALDGKVTTPAWKVKPTWYLVATDKMIPPDAQRFMSKRAGSKVVEAKGSHASYVSQPQAVTKAHRDRGAEAAKVAHK